MLRRHETGLFQVSHQGCRSQGDFERPVGCPEGAASRLREVWVLGPESVLEEHVKESRTLLKGTKGTGEHVYVIAYSSYGKAQRPALQPQGVSGDGVQ